MAERNTEAEWATFDKQTRPDDSEGAFGPIIASYSRAQAIEDGDLVDVSGVLDGDGRKVSPFKYPLAMSRAAWAETIEAGGEWVDEPNGDGSSQVLRLPGCQSIPGRLWDVCWMLLCAIRRGGSTDRIDFSVYVNRRGDDSRPKRVNLYSVCGPGDTPEPVLTIMLPGED